jgi:hypothetical protein
VVLWHVLELRTWHKHADRPVVASGAFVDDPQELVHEGRRLIAGQAVLAQEGAIGKADADPGLRQALDRFGLPVAPRCRLHQGDRQRSSERRAKTDRPPSFHRFTSSLALSQTLPHAAMAS